MRSWQIHCGISRSDQLMVEIESLLSLWREDLGGTYPRGFIEGSDWGTSTQSAEGYVSFAGL